MKNKLIESRTHPILCSVLIIICCVSPAFAVRPGWERKEVDWRGPAGLKVKAVRYPQDRPVPTEQGRAARQPIVSESRGLTVKGDVSALEAIQGGTGILAYVIDSPPIDGFVPWIAVGITDARSYDWMDTIAYNENAVTGNYLTASPQTDYALGIFDTGASAHTLNVFDAALTGVLDEGLVTSVMVTLTGATGDANAWVSQPVGVFLDGLEAIDASSLEVNDVNMAGQSNMSIVVGDIDESPNMPTVVGCPLAIFFTTVIRNGQQITLNLGGEEIVGPEISVYPQDDPRIPSYPNKINLELRPTDGASVLYFPCIEIEEGDCPDGDGSPQMPTTVWGFLPTQSLFFTSRTDLTHGIRTSQQKKFMFDTGAEVTVISEAQAAELELNPQEPDFEVEIMGIAGDFIVVPGFYIDRLEISATPQWLTYTNVPVIMVDIGSPEGGVMDGIVGMNLFMDMDFYIRGGGLAGQDQPYIKFQFLPPGLAGDIAPSAGNGKVDIFDLATLANAWLATPLSPDWNSQADMFSDAIINFKDYAILAGNWLQESN